MVHCFTLLFAVFLFVCLSASNVSGRSVPVQVVTTEKASSSGSSVFDSRSGRSLLANEPTFLPTYAPTRTYISSKIVIADFFFNGMTWEKY